LDASAATGPQIDGTGYSFHVPDGWGEPDEPVPGFDPDSFAMNGRDKDDFADNVNVLLFPGGSLTPDEAEKAARDELASVGVKDVVVNSRVQVGGNPSAHVTGQASINDLDYTVEQYYPTDDDQAYVVTFSFSADVPAEQRMRVTDATLVSWKWTD
jgi:hypothetical protein